MTRTVRRLNVWRLIPVFALMCLAPAPLNAHESNAPAPSNTVVVPRLGMEAFRYLLHRHEFQPLQNVDDVEDDPAKTVIILLGPDSIKQCLNMPVIRAVANGASILIATDRSADKTKAFGFTITDEVVNVSNAEKHAYLGKPEYPYIRPFRRLIAPDESSPRTIFKSFPAVGNRAIAANSAGVLHQVPFDIPPARALGPRGVGDISAR